MLLLRTGTTSSRACYLQVLLHDAPVPYRYYYITYLRDPVHRFLSEFRHVRRGATWRNARLFCGGRRWQVRGRRWQEKSTGVGEGAAVAGDRTALAGDGRRWQVKGYSWHLSVAVGYYMRVCQIIGYPAQWCRWKPRNMRHLANSATPAGTSQGSATPAGSSQGSATPAGTSQGNRNSSTSRLIEKCIISMCYYYYYYY